MVAKVCHPNTWEVEAEKSEVQGCLPLYRVQVLPRLYKTLSQKEIDRDVNKQFTKCQQVIRT